VVNSVVWPHILSGPGWSMSVTLFGMRLQSYCASVGKQKTLTINDICYYFCFFHASGDAFLEDTL